MSTGLVMSGSLADVSAIVPATLNVIRSLPGAAFESMIALRSDPAPESFRLLTMIVDISTRSSTVSRPGVVRRSFLAPTDVDRGPTRQPAAKRFGSNIATLQMLGIQ